MLIDTRPHPLYLKGHVPSAINIPVGDMQAMSGMLPADKSTELIFYCQGFT
jgi:rhodanese-related sulfurtransferase